MLDEYEKWIDKKIPISNEWDEELNNISDLREEIHASLNEIDINRLRSLDARWQSWILASDLARLSYTFPRSGVDKTHWWVWLDKFNELTEIERSTL